MKYGRKLGQSSQGATLVEFIVAAPMVIFLILGVIQASFFFIAKTQVNYAAEFAARYASTQQATLPKIKQGLRIGLFSMQTGNSTPGAGDLLVRNTKIALAMNNPLDKLADFTRINPSPACFTDWGVGNPKTIPNTNLHFKPTTLGPQSRQSIQDCNILKVRVVYNYKPVTPLIRDLLMRTLRTMYPLDLNYRRDRIPIEAIAIVHMQSDARQ